MFKSSFSSCLSVRFVKNHYRKPLSQKPRQPDKKLIQRSTKLMTKAEKRVMKEYLTTRAMKKAKVVKTEFTEFNIHHTAPYNHDFTHNLLTIMNKQTGGLTFVGHFSENIQRVLANSIFKSKFDAYLITGKLDWSAMAGLPGYLMGLAEQPNLKPLPICYPNDHLKLLLAGCRHFVLRKSIDVSPDTTCSTKMLTGFTAQPIITYPDLSIANQAITDLTEQQLKFLDECIAETFLSSNNNSADCSHYEDDFGSASGRRKDLLRTIIDKVKVKDMSVSYLIKFNKRSGKFDVEKASELGIEGKDRGLLIKNGELTLPDGKLVKLEDLSSPTRSFEDLLVLHVASNDYLAHLKIQLFEQKEFDSRNAGLVYLFLDEQVTLNQDVFDLIDLIKTKTLPDSNIFISHPEINSNQVMMNPYAADILDNKAMMPRNYPEINTERKVNRAFFGRYSHLSPQTTDKIKSYKADEEIPNIEANKVNIFNQDDSVLLHAFDSSDAESVAIKKQITLKDSSYKPIFVVKKVQRNEELMKHKKPVSLMDSSLLPTIAIMGTNSSKPSVESNVTSNLIKVPYFDGVTEERQDIFGYLDAGEGSFNTLKRLTTEKELTYIFKNMKFIYLSHLHADHLGGIVTVITQWYNYNKDDHNKKLYLLVPDGFLKFIVEMFANNGKILERIIGISLEIFKHTVHAPPLKTGMCSFLVDGRYNTINDDRSFAKLVKKMYDQLNLNNLVTVPAIHCSASYSSSFTFKTGYSSSWKVSISGDTRHNYKFSMIGMGSDYVIHEATFQQDLLTHAKLKKHSTVFEALEIAHKMKAKNVILTHFSARKFDNIFFKAEKYVSHHSNAKICVATDGIIINDKTMDAPHEKSVSLVKYKKI